MKRFALKRITALVLALVMTLSLLPMTAWATDAVSEGDENNTSTVEQTTDPAQLYWYGYRNVWTNEEYIADRGTTHWFDVGADSAGTVLTWTSTPEITLSSNTLGTFELFEENEKSRLKWDTTGALEGSGTVTLSLDSVDYVLNVRVNVLPMGLSAAGGDYSTAITLDQASYEWVLYAEQWNGDTQQNDYIRVTSDKFTIPNGGNLSFKDTDNDQVGDTLVFDAAGMEAADFPVDLYAVSIERGTYHRFQIRYNDGGDSNGPAEHKNVTIFTSYDETDGFAYKNGGVEIDDGTVGIPSAPGEKKTIYLLSKKPLFVNGTEGWTSKATLTRDDALSTKNESNIYTLTIPAHDAGNEGIVNLYWQDEQSNKVYVNFRFFFTGGGQNNYQPLFIYGKGEDENYDYFNGTGFSVGGMQELPLYLRTTGSGESFTPVSKNDVTFECSNADYNQYFSWSTETGKENVLVFDTRNISVNGETQIQLLMTKGSETFKLDLFLFPGGNQGGNNGPLELNGIQIFTSFAMGQFGYNDGDAAPWTQSIPNGPTMAFIPMMPKSDYTPNVVKSVYLVTGEELTLLTNNGSVFGGATLTLTDITLDNNRKVYLLQVPGQSADTDGDVRVKIGSSDNELLLHFRAQWNGQDMSCWKDYTTPSGNSTVTVRLSPDQAPLITLPESINEKNELIITVHNAAANNDAVWEALANRTQGFLIPFEYGSIEPSGVSKPQVKSIGTGTTIEKSLEMLENEEYKFNNYYQGGGGIRMNGLFFAWSMEDTGRTIIVPTEESATGAWIWRYEDNASETGYIDKKDGVIVKFVLDENISNAVTLGQNNAEFVSASQISERSYPTLNPVIDFERIDGAISYTDGTLTYKYRGEKTNYNDVTAELRSLAETHNAESYPKITLKDEQNGGDILAYPLLEISVPADGYRIQSVATAYSDNNYDGGTSVVLWYAWWGPGSEVTYTLTWVDADVTDGTNLPERVQQITIKTPALNSGEKWMDHINDGENHATPVPVDRMVFTQLDTDCGAQHRYTPGYMLTMFDNSNTDLDIEEILSTTIEVKAPAGAKAYRMTYSSDGNDDPTYNANNAWAAKSFQENIEAAELIVLADGQTATNVSPLEDPLRKQELGDIEYYYSADRGTRLILLKWIYDLEDENNKAGEAGQDPTYEYIQMDTTPYYCILKSALGDVEDDVVVDKPMADVTQVPGGNIYLETRIHPQNKGYGQYFFELRLVDGTGNTYVEYHEDGYTIILPYSFMGEGWNYEMAENLKEKPIINHYDKNFNLKKNNGAITGEYTERGIEFVVNDFSPFMLTWTEETKEPTSPVITASDDLIIAYGYKEQRVSIAVKEEAKHTYTYQWYNAENQAISGATSAVYVLPENLSVGTYSYYCVVNATRVGSEEEVSATSNAITVTIAKAQPSYTIPTNLTATYGQTLADVKLPAGWAWVDVATTSVGVVGGNKFAVEFTPEDTVNYNKVSGTATIAVIKQQIAKPAEDTNVYTYTGTEQTYFVADSALYTVNGNTRIDAGTQTVAIALKDKTNYAWVGGSSDDLNFTFTIAKATQAVPEVTGVNETVFAKNDGKIIGVTSAMEYSVDGETYTAITDGKLENLAPDTYYVRYAEKDNFLASDAVTVVIAAGERITVTFDTNDGNEIEAIENLVYGNKVTAPTEPKKSGYTFAGWFSDEACTKAWDFDKDTVSADVTLYAKWNAIPVVYPPYVPETPTTPTTPTETKPTTPAQPTTPPAEVTVPVSGEENTINVEASVSGSTATIDKVDMNQLDGVIGDDVAVGTVTIDFSVLESTEVIDEVEIPAEVVKEIAAAVADPNNDAESLEIVLSDGASIEFDAAALAEKAAQAGGADITISIKHAVETNLSAAQQTAVGDRVAFDINVTSGGVHISDMGGKITIHAPYELRDGETADGIVVYYVDDEGNMEKCETSYDSAKKRVNWKTDHLSVYMIAHEVPADDTPAVDETPADDATQSDSANGIGLWIGVALVVLVIAIVVVVIAIKRKKA